MINTTNAITPHSFMPGQPEPLPFYENTESTLYRVAWTHCHGGHTPLSMFSSWAASLNFVLCYARRIEARGTKAYVAIMDREILDTSVCIWHIPHIIPGSNLEYLAYGVIRGRGYKAVPLRDLEENGLMHIFRETARAMDPWGVQLRRSMFQKAADELDWLEFECIATIAFLFGNMTVPMASALLCLRPRKGLTPDSTSEELRNDSEKLKGMFVRLVQQLQQHNSSFELGTEPWMMPNCVDSKDCPDVLQWINLLRMLTTDNIFRPMVSLSLPRWVA
jgi:hypothetical protein